MRRILNAVVIVCAATFQVPPAQAAVPSVFESSVDPCLVFCPVSDIPFRVVVRDIGHQPIPNASVTLDFSGCPSFVHCLGVPPTLVVSDAGRTVSMLADAAGVAAFFMPMGGICPGNAVRVIANEVELATRSLASPDRDGNLFPDALDQAAIQALVGSSDPTADFDCSGVVDAADLALFAQHRFHACPLAVPALPRSWGALKLLYR
jgi:hypothetical protein